MTEAKYKVGDRVQVITTGEVITINRVSTGSFIQTSYYGMSNGRNRSFREADLIPYVDKEITLENRINDLDFDNAESFQKYAYYRLFSESAETNLYSYQGNKIIFNPFQYKPLIKFLSIESDERLLIADEVGVGKTIESGIILDELISRGDLKRDDPVLIVCPSILCEKWASELRNKFNFDDFYIHDGRSLNYMLKELKDSGRVQYPHNIVSEQLFRAEKYQNLLEEYLTENTEPVFKLLIVDECHHYRNPSTNTHKFGERLSKASDRVIMLSATPFNLRSDDLYNQLHILNPYLFNDQKVFNELLEQIQTVNQAIACVKKDDADSRKRLITYAARLKAAADSNEFISKEFNRLFEKIISNEELSVKDRVNFEKTANLLNPIATSFTRTLKRDAIEHRVTRETMTLEVHFTPQEENVYQSFLDTSIQRYRMFGISERAMNLILNGLERIASSSLTALQKNINRFIDMDDDEFYEKISDDMPIDQKTASVMKMVLSESYSELKTQIDELGDLDTKYNTFRQLIENVRAANGDNKRIIVFSFYTETLKYLRRRLIQDGYRVDLMYGGTPYETVPNKTEDGYPVTGRYDKMRAFENGEFDILLASEVGGEGLDFQFCSALINYDLPYNPMRIEQRIGRIDRMGQMADKIIIGNLCIANTIDMVINSVLLSRIAQAADLVGELEPIISDELIEINRLIITKEFNQKEIEKRERELEQRIEKVKQTREEFDEARYDLVNDKGFRNEFEDFIKKCRISPHESLLYTYSFLKKENGCWCKPITDTAAEIHVSKDMCGRISAYLKRTAPGKAGEELKQLLENNGDLVVEFNGDAAFQNEDRVFFKPAGIWIHFIAEYMKALEEETMGNVFYGTLKNGLINSLSGGRYWLIVYEMQFTGSYETRTYEYVIAKEDGSITVCLNEDDKKKLVQQIRVGKVPTDLDLLRYVDIRQLADNEAIIRQEEIMAEAKARNDIKIGSRIQAIERVARAQIYELQNQLIGASEKEAEKIRRKVDSERRNTDNKIKILEEKQKLVGSFAIDSACLIDII